MHLKQESWSINIFKPLGIGYICQPQFMTAKFLNSAKNSDHGTVLRELLCRGRTLSTKSSASYVSAFCSPPKFQQKT